MLDELDARVRWCELDDRYRLYRSQLLQENMRWKTLAEIYTMHSFAPFANLNFLFEKLLKFFLFFANFRKL